MAIWLKRGKDVEERAEANRQVRATVETILGDIEKRASQSADDPLSGLEIGQRPDPQPREGWVVVDLKASGLNHHDVWSLKGVGLPADRLPMILGCDGAFIVRVPRGGWGWRAWRCWRGSAHTDRA